MKFQCDRCKTRYSIADEKVRGKILKIRCKTCATIIAVKDPMVATGDAAAVSASGSFGAIPSATGSLPFIARTGKPPPPSFEPPADDGGPTRLSPPPVISPAANVPTVDEWFVSVDGEQDGPLSPAQAQARVAKKRPDEEMYVWREDFTDWLPVEEVPLLAVHLPRAGAPPPRMFPDEPDDGERSDDREAADEPPKPAADAMDFQIADASRVVRMPLLAPKPRGAPKRGRLPGMGAGAGAAAGSSAARGTAAQGAPATPANVDQPSPRDSLQLPIAGLSMEMPAQVEPRLTSEVSGAAAPHKARRRRAFYAFTIGGGVIVAGIIVGAITLIGRKGDDGSAGTESAPTVVTNFYEKGSLLGAQPALVPQPGEPAAPDKTGTGSRPARPPAVASRRPDIRDPSKNDTSRIAPATGQEKKTDTFGDDTQRFGPLTPDDVRETYLANEVMLKRCYERSLKQEASLPVSKMDVKITIDASGSVSRISVPQETGLASCVATAIRNWRFRRSTGDFTTEFTVVFAKRG